MKRMSLGETLHRINAFIDQHDTLEISGVANWLRRVNMIYIHHLEDLTKNDPEKVFFT
jgi:hypothetical protein